MTDRDTRPVSHAHAGSAAQTRSSARAAQPDIDPDLHRPNRPYGKPGRPYRVPLRHLVTVFLGGVAGTLARHGVGRLVPATDPWPWAILVVNLTGSLILGWVLEHLAATGPDKGRRRGLRLLLGVGFCGAFTTYSAFAAASPLLVTTLSWTGPAWLVVTLVGCCLTAWLGMGLGGRTGRAAAQVKP